MQCAMKITALFLVVVSTIAITSGRHSVQRRDSNGDTLIDEVIYEAVQELKNKHQEQIDIPNIDENFEKKITFFKVRGEFIGNGGWFRDLTTIKRTAPSEFVENGNSVSLGISLGLDDLEFGFKEYRAEVWHIGVHGTMRITIGENSVYAHLTMQFNDDGTCKSTLDKVEVKKLDGFHLEMTGLGRDADWLYSFVTTFLANKYHNKIEKVVTDRLTPAITNALLKKDICQQFPH